MNTINNSAMNLAIKCNFCDGGAKPGHMGFNGCCSDSIIKYNIQKRKRSWCANPASDCYKYFHSEISRREIDNKINSGGSVCYESCMLRDWIVGAGYNKKGKPNKMLKCKENGLAILTTKEPECDEEKRYIYGVFLIDEYFEGDDYEPAYATADSRYRIKLDEQEILRFWDHFMYDNCPDSIQWDSKLFRYVNDKTAALILREVMKVKKGTNDESLAKEFFEYFCHLYGLDINMILKMNKQRVY